MTEQKTLLMYTLANWSKLNLNRLTTTEKRRQAKIESVHALIQQLAKEAEIDEEYLKEAIDHHQKYTDPAPLLDSYRAYFPEFEELLQELRSSEAIDSRLRYTLS